MLTDLGAQVSTDDLGLKAQGFRLTSLRDWLCVLGAEPTAAEQSTRNGPLGLRQSTE